MKKFLIFAFTCFLFLSCKDEKQQSIVFTHEITVEVTYISPDGPRDTIKTYFQGNDLAHVWSRTEIGVDNLFINSYVMGDAITSRGGLFERTILPTTPQLSFKIIKIQKLFNEE